MTGVEAQTVFECSGCGATIVFSGANISVRCGYCDSPMIDEPRALATLERVIPFAIPERGALDRVRTHLQGRWLAPADLRAVRVHGRGVRGVLVPFWSYRGVVRSRYRARVGLDWYREVEGKDDDGQPTTRQVRETEWFPIDGGAVWQVEDHLVCASVGLHAHETAGLGGYDLGHAADYDPRLLSGLEAEVPSVTVSKADRSAAEELRRLGRNRIMAELLPGDRNRLDRVDSEVRIDERRLLLAPVWIASYRHRGTVRRVLVNGQTGVASGRVPLDRVKVAALVASLAALALALWWLAQWLERGWA